MVLPSVDCREARRRAATWRARSERRMAWSMRGWRRVKTTVSVSVKSAVAVRWVRYSSRQRITLSALMSLLSDAAVCIWLMMWS